MRPSSSPSEPAPGLFDGVLAAGPVRAAVSGPAWLAELLAVEVALARVQARLGLISAEAADAISAAADPAAFDVVALSAEAAAVGNPVQPLVRALRGKLPEFEDDVHKGATSQDILDTAAMLMCRRAVDLMLSDVDAAADRAAELAAEHRDSAIMARTLLQQAVPTTFGLVAAGWLTGLDGASARLRSFRPAAQFGGAAGTLAALGTDGVRVMEALAVELDLAVPALPWHTDRTRIADLAGSLGAVAGAAAKVGRDVTLHAQTEVGELGDRTERGWSSAMGHKRNPVAAVATVACAAQAPGLVATLLAAGQSQEYQRAAGGWHAEWRPLCGLLESVGSAAYWLRDCLSSLRVDTVRMRANLGAAYPESGRRPDPGSAPELVDRALAAYRERRA